MADAETLRGTSILLAAALGLGALALLEQERGLFAPAPLLAPEPVAAAAAPEIAPLEAAPAAWGDFSALIERPLFSPTRRPPERPQATAASLGPSEAALRAYRLVGIVGIGAERIALFRHDATGETVRRRLGEAVAGWTLTGIDESGVAFAAAAQEARLAMSGRDAAGSDR